MNADTPSPMFLLFAAAVGVLGVLHDASAHAWPAWLNLHGLFTVLLWLYAAAGWRRFAQPLPPTEVRAFTRRMSRRIYLLLYGLMFVRLLVAILHAAPHRLVLGPFTDFQSYLASGLLALATIHVLAAFSPRLALHGAAFPAGWISAKRTADVAGTR